MTKFTPGEIQEIFPKPLYIVDNLIGDSLGDLQKCVHELGKDCTANTLPLFPVKSKLLSVSMLKQYEETDNLTKTVRDHMFYYMRQIGLDYLQNLFGFTRIRLNFSYENDYVFSHVHKDSVITGIYYVKAPQDNKLYIQDNITSVLPESRNYNTKFNRSRIDVPCISDRLIVFKSDLVHYSVPQEPGEKIAMVFMMGRCFEDETNK